MIRTIAFLASVLAVLAHAEQANLVIQYGNPNGIWSAEFSPDGRFLVTIGAGLTSTASLWDVESGKQIGAWGSITSASFSADSRHVLVQVPSGVEARGIYSQEKTILPEQSGGAYSPDGKFIATSKGQTVTLWEAVSGNKVRTFEYDVLPGPMPDRLGHATHYLWKWVRR